MELIINYKPGIITEYPLLVSEAQFSMGTDTILNRDEIENLISQVDNDIYIMCNRMMFDEDILALKEHLQWIKEQDIKGIYYSDMAVYMIAEELDIVDRLMFAPGMPLVNSEDVDIYLGLGLKGVELANELTLEEKTNIMDHHPDKIGTVIGGYLMSSASRRHFLTNYFNEIDKDLDVIGNYNLSLVENTRDGRMPIYEDEYGTYIYSDYMLDSFEYLDELKNSDAGLLRVDTIFMDVNVANDLISGYTNILNGANGHQERDIFMNKHADQPFDIGFYDTETNLVKE